MRSRRWFLGAVAAALLAAVGLGRRRGRKEVRIPGKRLDRARLRERHDLRG